MTEGKGNNTQSNMTPEKNDKPRLLDLDKRVLPREEKPQRIEIVRRGEIGAEREYKAWQDIEEWNARKMEPLDKEKLPLPLYCEGMTDLEMREVDVRRELNNAAYEKRNMSPMNFATMAENKDFSHITSAEWELLYDIPGVKEALELYINLLDSSETISGTDKSLSECGSKSDLALYRNHIRGRLRDIVIAGYTNRRRFDRTGNPEEFEELVSTYCRDVEQIAFNWHFVFNTFESLDSKWDKDRRVRDMANFSPAVLVPIKNTMNPLDALVASTFKNEADLAEIGVLGGYVYRRVQESKRGMGNIFFREVVILPETKGNADKFWTVDLLPGDPDKKGNKPARLYAHGIYPAKLLRSAWEESTVKETDDGKPLELIEYLRAGRVIPWDKVSDGINGIYLYKVLQAGTLWDMFKGKEKLNVSKADFGSIEDWGNKINAALSASGRRDDTTLKRAILYSSLPIKREGKRLKLDNVDKVKVRLLLQERLRFLPRGKLFYPWDGESVFSSWM